MKKRGVVSVFIIIGIFILAIVAIAISMYSGLIPKPGFLSKDADAITTFTETCISTITRQAIDIMSVQGGYIQIPDELEHDDLYIDLGFKVPYWYNKGISKAPTIKMMQDEMNDYIITNLPYCINSYRDFSQFDVEFSSEIKTESKIGDRIVRVKTTYPLKVRYYGAEEVTYIDEFNIDIKTNFGKISNLARELMDWENEDGFLENYTDEMIACSDWLPYEGMELDCSPKIWEVNDMKSYTQQMIMHNLPFLMFENTDYEETGIDYYDGQYKVDFTRNDYRDFKVDVMYNPSWDMDFSVYPSKNGIVKPKGFTLDQYIMSCIKIYHHKYTLEYPVMFQITDVENPLNKFYFATPVIMKRGLSNRYREVIPWEYEFDEVGSAAYCSNTTRINLISSDMTGRMFSTPSLRNNRQYGLRIFVKDIISNEFLPDVNISYQCTKFKCDIGQTAYTKSGLYYTGFAPMLDTKFPECVGGLVIAEHAGYQREIEQASVGADTDGIQVNVMMTPIKRFDYIIKVIEEHNGLISERDLKEDEFVMLTITEEEKNFEKSIIYPSDLDYYKNLDLMVGDFKYEIDLKLVNEETYLGGLALNWSVTSSNMQNGRYIKFYVIKKDPIFAPQSPEDYQELLDYAMDNSEKYPPKIR